MDTGPSGLSADAHRSGAASASERRWQNRLLPFMTGAIVLLAVAFFAISIYNVNEVKRFILMQSQESVSARVEQVFRSVVTPSDQKLAAERAVLLLEAEAMDRRYGQANALLMSRIWTRQLAFITGMVLAFIGSVFILGKLREAPTQTEVGAEHWKASMSSSSPGLVLAFLGTILMALSVLVQYTIGVQDRPVYVAGVVQSGTNGEASKSPETSKAAIDPGMSSVDGRK